MLNKQQKDYFPLGIFFICSSALHRNKVLKSMLVFNIELKSSK